MSSRAWLWALELCMAPYSYGSSSGFDGDTGGLASSIIVELVQVTLWCHSKYPDMIFRPWLEIQGGVSFGVCVLTPQHRRLDREQGYCAIQYWRSGREGPDVTLRGTSLHLANTATGSEASALFCWHELRVGFSEPQRPWATGDDLVPPGQARMVDSWSDYTGCWADVYDHEQTIPRPVIWRVKLRCALGGAKPS